MKKDKKAILGCDVCEKIIRKTDALISIIKMNGPIGQFDEQLFQTIVAKVWIGHDKRISYELINGLKLSVNANEVM